MYQDNTLLPREVIRMAALGTLAGRAVSYAELANEVRHFVSRIAGPSLDLMGTSIELLRYEGLVSPMDMYSAVDGAVGDFHFVHFGSLAFGGAGLIFAEMTCVSEEGRITPGCAGLYHDDHIAAWKKCIDFVQENSDAKFCLQIGHAGRKGSTRVAWEGMDKPLEEGNWPLIAPSALPFYPESQTPREMTRNDMDQVQADFVRATQRAIETGADMIELPMAHGYLLTSFITPVSKQRDDE